MNLIGLDIAKYIPEQTLTIGGASKEVAGTGNTHLSLHFIFIIINNIKL